jgi:hypothetical protein
MMAAPLAAAVIPGGCASLEQAAPPVETIALQSSAPKRVQLEQGRTIYITKCAKCHSPEPVHRYTVTRWQDILSNMTAKAKLDPSESAAVRDYVFAAIAQKS